MRVAVVLTSLGAGGTERSTAVLLPELMSRGIEPEVITLVPRDVGDEELVRAHGIPIHRVGRVRLAGRVRELRGLLEDLGPALVHTAIFDADIAGRLAAWGTGVPVLSSLVNTPYVAERFGDPNVSPAKLRATQALDAVTGHLCTTHFHAVSAGVASHAVRTLRLPRDRITVVERGRPTGEFDRPDTPSRARTRAELDIAAGDELVLAVGRQEYQKGYETLIDAVALLAPTRPRLRLVIAGREGNATDGLRRAIATARLDDRVQLLGHRQDVPALLAAADVFAMPSRYEGTAGAALEALAMEVPVVATRLEGTTGILENGVNCVLADVGDVRGLALAIADALDDRVAAEARARAGRTLFEERFSMDRCADTMATLYRDVAAMSPRGIVWRRASSRSR